MSLMALDVHQASVVQMLKVAGFDRQALTHCRQQLGTPAHRAEHVGRVGAQLLRSTLNNEVLQAIAAFPGSGYKALLLRGIELSTEVRSPCDGFLPEAECVLDFDLLHFGMLDLLGVRCHAVEYENLGKLVRNVVPVAHAVGTTSSWGADVDFSWHTDNPNWPFGDQAQDVARSVPNYLAFIAVRNQEQASTDIVCIDHVLAQLPSWAIEHLSEPSYAFGAPASNEGFDGPHRVMPILERGADGYRLRFDDGIVTALNPRAEAALSQLRAVLGQVRGIELVLQPGDFFIFKNTRVLHRRRAFKPLPEGQARWLRRVYGN
ncbi:TauD/TfdA family dioxygenase [Pseudomonas sp. S75]|uniref:TauD/TfdA family dioxygenase n=1 Tax=unclassified Pseudomonas TaxID=196821 RepID=UPI001908D295|nr:MULTISPECIES: TauD/TfdA family dioxygenase [unclassified Pseudomonas]MBJ9977533.1 TauD/TfdA family dioxygenase [Pseudomonas sp. S30]MBK0155196.1 TauD/TfdA family dioxygenase [Pseudomonas sp. S75]